MSTRSYKQGWIADFWVGPRQIRKKFPSKREAVEYEDVMKGDYRRGKLNLPIKAPVVSFQGACDKYLSQYAIPNGCKPIPS